MASVTRTVRFPERESQLIEMFLEKNPFLDFSTLVRLSVTRFIQNPDLKVHAVETKRRPNTRVQTRAGKA